MDVSLKLQLYLLLLQVVSYGQSGVVETVNLTRTSRGRIGLIIKESDDGRIYVDDVVPGEPAAVEGNLKNGDLILEVCLLFLLLFLFRAGMLGTVIM